MVEIVKDSDGYGELKLTRYEKDHAELVVRYGNRNLRDFYLTIVKRKLAQWDMINEESQKEPR